MDAQEDTTLRRNHRLTSRLGVATIAALTAFFVTFSGQAFAQGFDLGQLFGGGGGGGGSSGSGGGLSQLFGGAGSGGGGSKHQRSGQGSGSGISVERSAPPFTGKFTGKQEDQGAESTISAQFACYPASDSDIPQAKAFVCYTGGSNAGGSASGGPPPGGPSDGGPPPYGRPGVGPPNGPPPDVE